MIVTAEIAKYISERACELEGDRRYASKIVKEVKDRFEVVITDDHVRYWLRKTAEKVGKKGDDAMKMLDEAIDEKKNYSVEGESVTFHVNRKSPDGTEHVEKYAIPFSELEAVWYDYSQHGKNVSGKKVIVTHEIKRDTFALIRSRLNLTKDDNAIPRIVLDYLLEKYGMEEVEKKILEVTHRAHEDRYKKKFSDADKKVNDMFVRRGKDFTEQVKFFREAIEIYEPKKVDFVPDEHPDVPGTLNVFFSDFHFGNGNDAAIIKRMDRLFQHLIVQPQRVVVLNCLGDLVENFSPNGMHDGQLVHMSMHGRKLAMFVVDVFEKFILGLHKKGKVVKFQGKGGNHDRISEKHGTDSEKTAAWMLYELIKRGLQNVEVEIEYFMKDVTTYRQGNLHFISHHGDDGFSNRKMEDILWKNGDQNAYNVVVHGDKHNFTFKETKNATMVGLPALAGRGTYDTMLDLHSEPGAVIITENSEGKADFFKKTLP